MPRFADLSIGFAKGESAVDLSRIAILVPTCNAEPHWGSFSEGLRHQGISPAQILIIDSSSDDRTRELAAAQGFSVCRIERRDFNHGGTRQLGATMVPWADVVVFLTQDAVLATPDAVEQLLAVFRDSTVAAAYGRQLPRPEAGPIEAHARLFNYPPQSEIRDYESRRTLGIKAAFLSNSFAAYRVGRLMEVGGFPTDAILSEDAIVAGKLLLAGWKTAYVAEAQVYHSHDFTVSQEFRRYFDIGVCHRRESWLRGRFGRAAGEGKRFVRSEMKYLLQQRPRLIPVALLRTVAKAVGYQLGLHGTKLGRSLSTKFSYHRSFWSTEAAQGDVVGPEARELSAADPAASH